MKRKLFNSSRRYQDALRTQMKQGRKASLASARGLGNQALAAGLQTLDLAKLHEQTLVTELLPGCPSGKRAALVKQAGAFFAEAILPIEKTHFSAQAAAVYLRKIVEALSRRTVELAASNLELNLEVTQRKAAETALKKSERHYSELLEQSDRLQEQLRQLSRQILSAQEEERREISRELHDVIAQTLTGINVRLAALKTESSDSVAKLHKRITSTQRLVEKSVDIVHRFARELRPTVLDDLGLIPALQSFMKGFIEDHGVRVSLKVSAGIESFSGTLRTMLYRVAQEALTNVSRHAKATQVTVCIESLGGSIRMDITDNGQGFDVAGKSNTKKHNRLGLLGMRERVEMVGGTFCVESSPDHSTTVRVAIPASRSRTKRAPRSRATPHGGGPAP